MSNIEFIKQSLQIARNNEITFRDEYNARAAVLAESIEKLENDFNDENQELIADLESAVKTASELDGQLRAALIEFSKAENKKTFDNHLSVKVMKKLIYSPAAALEWAKAHGLCLSLDVKSFEKIAAVQKLDFVTVEENYSAVVAKKFNK